MRAVFEAVATWCPDMEMLKAVLSLAYTKESVQRRLLLCYPGVNGHTQDQVAHHLMQGHPLLGFEEPGCKCIVRNNHLQASGRQQSEDGCTEGY